MGLKKGVKKEEEQEMRNIFGLEKIKGRADDKNVILKKREQSGKNKKTRMDYFWKRKTKNLRKSEKENWMVNKVEGKGWMEEKIVNIFEKMQKMEKGSFKSLAKWRRK